VRLEGEALVGIDRSEQVGGVEARIRAAVIRHLVVLR
jgi:hypothetical protein